MNPKQEEKLIENSCTSHTGTFPIYTKTGEKERLRGRYITPGDTYFNAHLSYYMKNCVKDPKQLEKFKKKINKCLENEIAARAENKMEKRKDALNQLRSTPIDKQTFEKVKGQYTKGKVERFKTQINKEKREIANVLNRAFRSKKVTSYKTKEEKEKPMIAHTPLAGFTKEMVKISSSTLMVDYLNSLVNNCAIWIQPADFRKLPIVYPHKIRRGEKEQQQTRPQSQSQKQEVKWDKRGFILESNPIASQLQKKNIIGGFLKGEKIKGSSGYIACHIWYKTTLAPPLFTYIPNIVWLPRIIARMSDEPMERDSNKLPLILKQFTKCIYQSHNAKKIALSSIINTIWLELSKEDEDKSKKKIKLSSIPKIKLGDVKSAKLIEKIITNIDNFREKKKPSGKAEVGPEGYLNALYTIIQKSKDSFRDLNVWLSEFSKAISKSSTNWKNQKSDFIQTPKELQKFVQELCNRKGLSTDESKLLFKRKQRVFEWIKKCADKKKSYSTRKEFEECFKVEFEECKDTDKGDLKFYTDKFIGEYNQFRIEYDTSLPTKYS